MTAVLFITVSLVCMSDTQQACKYVWKKRIHLGYVYVSILVGSTRTLVSGKVQILAANVTSKTSGWVQPV